LGVVSFSIKLFIIAISHLGFLALIARFIFFVLTDVFLTINLNFGISGFISILCGGKTTHTDENNIKWVNNANYIDIGQTTNTGNANLPSYLQNLRLFPMPLKKACYQLPVALNVSYLIRASFVVGNNDGYQALFAFSIETSGMLWREEMVINYDPISYENILVSSGRVLCVCLKRSGDTNLVLKN
jgi:hypothetical protein